MALAVLVLSRNALLRWSARLALAVTLWLTAASFWAFHMMFDRPELLSGSWLKQLSAVPPRTWVQITTSLDQTTLPMQSLFPHATGHVIDIYDPTVTTEPALSRARRVSAPSSEDVTSLAGGSADLVVVMLAAHEIRQPEGRQRLLSQTARIVATTGRVVLVEHLRDFAATLAFGPGVFHFFPRSMWLRLIAGAGLEVEREFSITPFVRVFVTRRPVA